MREQWEDRTQAPEVRLAAAIGWLCLTDEPTPDDLRAAVDNLATNERAHAMDDLPRIAFAGGSGETGLRRASERWSTLNSLIRRSTTTHGPRDPERRNQTSPTFGFEQAHPMITRPGVSGTAVRPLSDPEFDEEVILSQLWRVWRCASHTRGGWSRPRSGSALPALAEMASAEAGRPRACDTLSGADSPVVAY